VGGKGAGKKNKKGAQASRTQQQQQAAARRSLKPSGISPGSARTSGGTGLRAETPTAAPAPPAQAETEAKVKVKQYVDVSAVRIQDWLGRTPDLKFHRGGSVLLSESTEREHWVGRLPAGARWNDEAGEVDGVVSLVLDEAAVLDEDPVGGPADRAADVARQVVGRMRAAMPHCALQAVAGAGQSYAIAYSAMAAARRDGRLLIDSPPAPSELILAKPCDQCRAAPASMPGVPVTSGERRVDLCGECAARLDAAGRTAGRPGQAPRPERRLRRALAEAGMDVADFSGTFADIAAAGQRDLDDKATQVALVYADGNRVGAFLDKAAKTPGGPDKSVIAQLLAEATLGALAAAVINRFSGWARPPIVVNLAGGDDILVSVPAADAWLFTRTLIASFTAILAERAAGWPRSARDGVPTLAAGLVFHHVKTPFSDVVRLAAGQLREAKAKTRGSAAIAFLDLTADGNTPPAGRLPVTLHDLDTHAARLTQVAALPASRRQHLLDLYRDGDQDGFDGFIARLTDREDNEPLWQIAAGPDATAPAIREELRGSKARRDEVRRALDMARHWRASPRTEPPAEKSQPAREALSR
jgi:hypothetical protein